MSVGVFTVRRSCRSPGCRALVEVGGCAGAWCAAHKRATPAARVVDRARGTAQERGYGYGWQQARLAFLARFPLCCGVLMPAEDWSAGLAKEFHAERERRRESGDLLWYSALGTHEPVPGFDYRAWDVGQAGVVVDHIIPHRGSPELMWSEWNWQPLTKRAHDRKTAREGRRTLAGAAA